MLFINNITIGGQMKRKYLVIGSAAVLTAAAVYLVFSINRYYPLFKAPEVHYPPSFYKSDYGTAENLDGKTVCVSLYINGENQTWKGHDDLKDKYRGELGMAVSWLADRAGEYGKSAEFVWDWEQYPELYFDVDDSRLEYSIYLDENHGDNLLWNFMDNNVPAAELLEKFGADNIIYIAFFNTPSDMSAISYAQDCYFNREYSYDTVYLSAGNSGHEATASTIAHEILHLYGLPDFYKQGPSGTALYGVNAEMVEYMAENYPDDIMVRTFDHENDQPYYGEVNGIMSPVTAYYAGLTDEVPQAVIDFGIDLSFHDPNRSIDSD